VHVEQSMEFRNLTYFVFGEF